MRYSVCLNALFRGMPIAEAAQQARDAGADACEFWGWADVEQEKLMQVQLPIAAMCTSAFCLTDPSRREEYLNGLRASLPVAKRLNCPSLITQVGPELAQFSRELQHQSVVDGLKACVPLLEEAKVTLLIEPLNALVNHRGTYLTRSDEAFAIVREVSSPYVKVLFDIYHQQITEGNLIANLTANVEWIGHIHIAGCPGRHEPFGVNEIHYPSVLSALEAAGYKGYVGLEYFPENDVQDGLYRILRERVLEHGGRVKC